MLKLINRQRDQKKGQVTKKQKKCTAHLQNPLLNIANLKFHIEISETETAHLEIEEFKKIALRISTPEGISEIINDLDQRLKDYPDPPGDPEFEKLTLYEKIDKLYQLTSI